MKKKSKKTERISQEEYFSRLLRNQTADDRKRIEKAYEQAWRTRDFEITNYWKRTLYFWGFQVAVFAGYFTLFSQERKIFERCLPLFFCVSCIGFITALAWVLANGGSKSWQENWEQHVDMLEDYVTGPLYKIIGKQTYSVSRVNLWVSRFFAAVWLVLGVYHFFVFLKPGLIQNGNTAWLVMPCLCITVFTAVKLVVSGKSSNKTINKKEFFYRPNIFPKGENRE